jgi:ABC-2 type transport system ATP-binding protein
MTDNVVEVEALRKLFRVPVREAGLRASMKSLVKREMKDVAAVDGIDFAISAGEVVGFLGANGAGKTTTLKMLSGLLHPTSGKARVLGHVPERRERELLRRITLVMGNRNQLQWDLPAVDSFELNRAVYGIPRSDFEAMRDELVELLELGPLVHQPVRQLSLGERMKMEFAGALLHRPGVLFLDEPTIGLDVTMQKRIRAFVAEYNRRHGASVLLTSHYMADVEALCRRVILIHHGRLLFDGELSALSERFVAHKTLAIHLVEDDRPDAPPRHADDFARYGEVIQIDGDVVRLRVARADAARTTSLVLNELPVSDLTIEDPPIEDVIEQAFAGAEP